MNSYEKLLEKIKDFIHSKGKVELSELIRWAKENNIGLITLSMIVNDLLNEGVIKGKGNLRELEEEPLAYPIPEILHTSKEEGLSKEAETKSTISTKSSTQSKMTKLIRFSPLFSSLEEDIKEKKREKQAIEEKTRKSLEKEKEDNEHYENEVIKIDEGSIEEEDNDILGNFDDELRRAIEYLNEYPSVGELRFLIDLKSLGVKNPNQVLYRLIDLGFIERKPLGVIDATDKLPKIKVRRKFPELSYFI